MRKKILFIVNPISGVGKQKLIEHSVDKNLDKRLYEPEIIYTERAGHAYDIARENCHNFEIITAVGGDGSVSETGTGLIGSPASLAIIPTGSGNGLARALGIPLDINSAVKLLNNCKTEKIDTLQCNEIPFVNVAGVGFDAHIAHLFAGYGKRGFLSYIRIILREFRDYPGVLLKINADGQESERQAFLATFANSSQYGNDGHIAPLAVLNDGYMDVCIVRRFNFLHAPFLALRLFRKNIHKSKFMETYRAKEVFVDLQHDGNIQYDGEPATTGKRLHIKILPSSLNVIVSKNHHIG